MSTLRPKFYPTRVHCLPTRDVRRVVCVCVFIILHVFLEEYISTFIMYEVIVYCVLNLNDISVHVQYTSM